MNDDVEKALIALNKDLSSLIKKYNKQLSTSPSSLLAVVKTHLEAANTRVEQELAKYVKAATILTPHPQTQTEEAQSKTI